MHSFAATFPYFAPQGPFLPSSRRPTQTGGTALVITVLVGEQVAISTEGVYELPKLASAVIAAGARVSWDDTAK